MKRWKVYMVVGFSILAIGCASGCADKKDEIEPIKMVAEVQKIQMEDYIKKQTEYRACKEAAQEKIKELSDKYEIYKMQLLGNPDYFAVYETFLKTEELNKMLIDVLVKKITVAENTKIEITFQFEDEMKMLYERLKESCSA